MGIIARTRQKRTHQVAATQTLARHASVDGERQRERAERQAFPASFRIALPIYRGRRSVGISIWLRGSKSYRNPMPGPTEAI